MRSLLVAGLVAGAASAVSAPAQRAEPARRAVEPMPNAWPPPPAEPAASGCSTALVGSRRTYNVGPGQAYTELSLVPWPSLQAGDVVNIFHRPKPYRTKIGLSAQGLPNAPVIVNGVTDAQCSRPEIKGEDAITAGDAALDGLFNKRYTEPLGEIFIHKGSNDPWNDKPRHIVIHNLKITGASARSTYLA